MNYLRMEIQCHEISVNAKRLSLQQEQKEIARIWVYFIRNDLHAQPYALIEDLFVNEEFRNQGLGATMLRAAIEEAKKAGCYKLIGTSRHEREQVHQFYAKNGFKDYGKEFRIEL